MAWFVERWMWPQTEVFTFVQVWSYSLAGQGTEASPIRDMQLQVIGSPASESSFPRRMWRITIRGGAKVNGQNPCWTPRATDVEKPTKECSHGRWASNQELDGRHDQASNQEISPEMNMKLLFLGRMRIFGTLVGLCATRLHEWYLGQFNRFREDALKQKKKKNKQKQVQRRGADFRLFY